MNEFLLAGDIIAGKEGRVITNVDGRTRVCAEVRNITATITKNKTEVRTLGQRGTQHKTTGWSGAGSATVYYVTSEWAKQIIKYVKTGVDTYFDMIVINEDPSSAAHRQEVHLIRCNIDGIDVARVDTEADLLDATFNFTFSDVDMPKEFDPIAIV